MANLNGRKFSLVTGNMLIGQCQNFVHLVTGHTLGRIERNGTVLSFRVVLHSDGHGET